MIKIENQKFCTNCGKEIEEDGEFCSSCGEKISGDSEISSNIKEKTETKKKVKKQGISPIFKLIAIIIFISVIAIVAVVVYDIAMDSFAQPEIVVPDGFVLQSNESGILTYVESDTNDQWPLKIDIQKTNVPFKNYTGENCALLTTTINGTEYAIIIYDDYVYNPYAYSINDGIAQMTKKRINFQYEEMINKGHLNSNIGDVKFIGYLGEYHLGDSV